MSTRLIRKALISLVMLCLPTSMLIASPGTFYNNPYFYIYIPDSVQIFRAAIIHMHGGGRGGDGPSIPYDLQYQSLAHKWDALLIGPSYPGCESNSGGNSLKDLLATLDTLAVKLGHPELKKIPWCLWGHSCGGYWVTSVLTSMPGRCIAAFPRSGEGDISNNAAALTIPVWGDQARQGSDMDNANLNVFPKGRAKGAPWTLSINPVTQHDCGYSRYLAIPFFDECLRQRLPIAKGTADSVILKPIDTTNSWLADMATHDIASRTTFTGDAKTASWIASAALARKWREYVLTGTVVDSTAPSAPYRLADSVVGQNVILRWEADADLESGAKKFIIYRDNVKIGELSGGWIGYGDNAEGYPAALRYADTWNPLDNQTHTYQVSQVNNFDAESPKTSLSVLCKDVTAPRVINVSVGYGATQVQVQFDEPLEGASGAIAGNYSIPGITISLAVVGSDNMTVTLTTTPLTKGTNYSLTIRNLKDRSSPVNTLASSTFSFYYNDILLWWRFDEFSGGLASDASGYGNNGQLFKDYTHSTDAKEGVNSISLAKNGTVWTPLAWKPDAFTVSFWIKPNSASDYNQGVGAGGWGMFAFHAGNGGALYCGTGVNSRFILPGGTLATGLWQHFAFTFNNGIAKLYKNGAMIGDSAKNWEMPSPWHSFSIGNGSGDGLFDDMRVYSCALPASEVAAIYSGVSGLSHQLTNATAQSGSIRANLYKNMVVVHFNSLQHNTRISLLNLHGALLGKSVTTGSRRGIIQTEGIVPGLYYLKVSGSGATTGRVIHLQ